MTLIYAAVDNAWVVLVWIAALAFYGWTRGFIRGPLASNRPHIKRRSRRP